MNNLNKDISQFISKMAENKMKTFINRLFNRNREGLDRRFTSICTDLIKIKLTQDINSKCTLRTFFAEDLLKFNSEFGLGKITNSRYNKSSKFYQSLLDQQYLTFSNPKLYSSNYIRFSIELFFSEIIDLKYNKGFLELLDVKNILELNGF